MAINIVDEPDAIAEAAVPASLNAEQFADSLATGPITISGEGNPGEEIEVLLDEVLLGVALADDAGNWTIDAQLLAPGDYSLRASNAAGDSDPVAISVVAATAIAGADATLAPTEPAAIAAAATAVEATVEVPAPTPDEVAPVETVATITPTIDVTATVPPDTAVSGYGYRFSDSVSNSCQQQLPLTQYQLRYPLRYRLRHPRQLWLRQLLLRIVVATLDDAVTGTAVAIATSVPITMTSAADAERDAITVAATLTPTELLTDTVDDGLTTLYADAACDGDNANGWDSAHSAHA